MDIYTFGNYRKGDEVTVPLSNLSPQQQRLMADGPIIGVIQAFNHARGLALVEFTGFHYLSNNGQKRIPIKWVPVEVLIPA